MVSVDIPWYCCENSRMSGLRRDGISTEIGFVWFDKTLGWSYKDAFLGDNTVSRIPRALYHVSYFLNFLQDNTAVFIVGSIACKEKSDEVVSREVDEISFAAIVLDFRENLKVDGSLGELFSRVPNAVKSTRESWGRCPICFLASFTISIWTASKSKSSTSIGKIAPKA